MVRTPPTNADINASPNSVRLRPKSPWLVSPEGQTSDKVERQPRQILGDGQHCCRRGVSFSSRPVRLEKSSCEALYAAPHVAGALSQVSHSGHRVIA